MVLGTFTPEVATSFQFLRDAIEDVPPDGGLRQTLTAIVDGLVHQLENQMLLVFANCSIREAEREALLEKGRHDVSLLAYYQEATKVLANQTNGGGSGVTVEGTCPPVNTTALNGSHQLQQHNANDDAQLRSLAPDAEVAKQLMAMLHGQAQSAGHNCHAERCVVYLNQKSTGSLKVLVHIPDHTVAVRGMAVPNHQGVIGSCFATGIAVRVDTIDAEKRKTMYSNQLEISSALVVPIVDPIQGQPIGVLELLNKTNGAPWTQLDEAHAFHAAWMMQYILFHYGSRIDFFLAPVFNPTQMFVVQPYHPGQLTADLARLPGAQSGAFVKTQLVARVTQGGQLPTVRKGAAAAAAMGAGGGGSTSLYRVEDLSNVRELAEYLELLDYNMRANINELVASKQREAEAKESIQRLQIRVKVQEENAQHLQDQLNDAKRVILAQKISAAEMNNNTGRFGDSTSMMTYRPGMTTRQSLTQRSLQKIPLSGQSREGKHGGGADSNRSGGGGSSKNGGAASSTQQGGGGGSSHVVTTLRPSSLQDFLSHAAEELERLQKKALGNSHPAQRFRMISQTPPPSFGGASVGGSIRHGSPVGGRAASTNSGSATSPTRSIR